MASAAGYGPIFDDPTSFARLRVEPWRQFNALDLDLTSRLTVLTGSNGSGKTTILSLLSAHFNWSTQLLSSPVNQKNKPLTYRLGTGRIKEQPSKVVGPGGISMPFVGYGYAPPSVLGTLTYENGLETDILAHETNSPLGSISYEQQQGVEGVFFNSHRSLNPYQPLTSIPSSFLPPSEIFNSVVNELRFRFFGQASNKTSTYVMKEALLAAAIYGEGNSAVTPDPEAAAVWVGFQDILRLLLPKEVGFIKLNAVPPEIILVTKTGTFALEALSGGLSAIFELAWQIYLRSRNTDSFTVCLDEPENHLHPSLQRSILPSLMHAFPKVKFLVASHSPFVVTSEVDARIYVLHYDDSNKVSASVLDGPQSGLSAEDTLRDVLGVGSTLPIWAENKFNDILSKYSDREPNSSLINNLREDLVAAGLATELPYAVERVANLESETL
jgi:hypothetical protein